MWMIRQILPEQTTPKCSGVKLLLIRFMNSVDQVIRQSTAGTASLCSLITGGSAEGYSVKSSEGSFTHIWQWMDAGLLLQTLAEAVSWEEPYGVHHVAWASREWWLDSNREHWQRNSREAESKREWRGRNHVTFYGHAYCYLRFSHRWRKKKSWGDSLYVLLAYHKRGNDRVWAVLKPMQYHLFRMLFTGVVTKAHAISKR